MAGSAHASAGRPRRGAGRDRADRAGRLPRAVADRGDRRDRTGSARRCDRLVHHPADLAVARVRGTKNPDVAAVVALAPDLVLANDEENRDSDIAELRAAGLAVWVTAPRTLDAAFVSLARMLAACGLSTPGWLDAAECWSPASAGRLAARARVRRDLAPALDVPRAATRSPATC